METWGNTGIFKLSKNPFIGRVMTELDSNYIREVVFHENYGIVYEVYQDTIEILTVRHFKKLFSSEEIRQSR
jgi:toxin ParE1/3/4